MTEFTSRHREDPEGSAAREGPRTAGPGRISGEDDAALVAAIRAGDPEPWGVIFDRYRDMVWRLAHGIVRRRADAEDVVSATFLKAVESIDQLRDPAALRPWLLSIARRRSLDVVSRGREVARDPAEGDWIESVATGSDALVAGLRQEDLARLVAAAFDGLEPRDRAALELAECQELSGEELAISLDVTRDNAYQLLHSARDRFHASVSSLVVARQGRGDCDDLDSLLVGWDGELTPLLRKRLARHLRRCKTCSETRRLQVTPAALLAVLPIVGISTLAADQSRASAMAAASGATTSAGYTAAPAAASSSLGLKLGAAAVAAILAGGAGFIMMSSDEDAPSAERAVVEAAPGDDQTAGSSPTDSSPVTATPAETAPTSSAPASSAPTSSAPTSSAPATTIVVEDFCTVVAEFSSASAGGPASGDQADISAYLVTVDGYLQRLVAASTPATPELEDYAEAYAAIVKAGAGSAQAAASDPALSSLKDTVEAQLAESCGG